VSRGGRRWGSCPIHCPTHHDIENLQKVLDAMRDRDTVAAAIAQHVIGFLKPFHASEIRAVAWTMHV
jgi:hypothetical protein